MKHGVIIQTIAVIGRTALSRLVSGYPAGKVFAIGFNKTGTMSLHHIFQDLGYRSNHSTRWRKTSRRTIFYFYDSFCDGPPDDFRRLYHMFPGSKFILQVRDLDSWLDSRLEHILRLPPGKVRPPEWTAKESSVRAWVRKRNEYHADVLSFFRERPDQFLLVNYIRDPEAARKISRFLGGPDRMDKPHANRNPGAGTVLKHRDMIAAALGGLGVPESEWKNDILCPSLGVANAGLPPDTSELVPAH